MTALPGSDPVRLPRCYRAFGGVLSSAVDFPELRTAESGKADWVLDVSDSTPPVSLRCLGEDDVHDAIKVACHAIDGGLALSFDDTGVFTVDRAGSRIVWHAPADRSDKLTGAARADILGRVIALAMHAQGVLCLHASAVRLGEGAVALMAPKFHGKSTLAAALVQRGAGLISDDTVPITPGRPPMVRPGLPQLRLWPDAAAATGPAGAAAMRSGKSVFDHASGIREVEELVPLAAAYIVVPVDPASSPDAVTRHLIPALPSALQLVAHAKLGPLLGGSEGGTLLERAAEVAASAPVYALHVARDIARLPAVADRMLEWHGRPS